jgi:hypothetical protein
LDPHEILKHFEERTPEIVSGIRSIVDIESPSHDADASRRVVDAVELMARATGVEIEVERFEVAAGTHLLITAFADKPDFTLLLGHSTRFIRSVPRKRIQRVWTAIGFTAAARST